MGLLDSLKKAFAGNPRVDLSTRFERLKEAVAGTMSKFYKARDLTTGKVVGLKLLDSKKLDPIEARYRGLGKPTEGEIGLQINGENIVKTLEWGVARDGTKFVVQEYIEGPGLQTIVDRSSSAGGEGPRGSACGGVCAPRCLPTQLSPRAGRQAGAD
jgi:serine/threonine protein kinase